MCAYNVNNSNVRKIVNIQSETSIHVNIDWKVVWYIIYVNLHFFFFWLFMVLRLDLPIKTFQLAWIAWPSSHHTGIGPYPGGGV